MCGVYFILLLCVYRVLSSNAGGTQSKLIHIDKILFNTLCGEDPPNFYIRASTHSGIAETTPLNLEFEFPDPLEIGTLYEGLNKPLLIWQFEIEGWELQTLDLIIYQYEQYSSDPLISYFTIKWSELAPMPAGADITGHPGNMKQVAGSSHGREACKTEDDAEEVSIWLFSEDASNYAVDGSGKLIAVQESGNAEENEEWQIVVLVCLSVAVVMIALFIPFYFVCQDKNHVEFSDSEEEKDAEFLEKKRKDYYDDEYDYTSQDGYRNDYYYDREGPRTGLRGPVSREGQIDRKSQYSYGSAPGPQTEFGANSEREASVIVHTHRHQPPPPTIAQSVYNSAPSTVAYPPVLGDVPIHPAQSIVSSQPTIVSVQSGSQLFGQPQQFILQPQHSQPPSSVGMPQQPLVQNGGQQVQYLISQGPQGQYSI